MGDMYTPEAYLLFKRLEFKNIISRFDQDTAPAALEIPKARQETSPDLLWRRVTHLGEPVRAFITMTRLQQVFVSAWMARTIHFSFLRTYAAARLWRRIDRQRIYSVPVPCKGNFGTYKIAPG